MMRTLDEAGWDVLTATGRQNVGEFHLGHKLINGRRRTVNNDSRHKKYAKVNGRSTWLVSGQKNVTLEKPNLVVHPEG